MTWSDLSKDARQKFLISIAGSVILILIVTYVLLLPQLKGLGQLHGKVRGIRDDLEQGRIEIRRRELYRQKALDYKKKIEDYEKRLLAREDIPSILEMLSDMARDSGTKIIAMSPMRFFKSQIAKEGRPYQEIPILISARSGYHQLGKFINRLENADWFMKVVDIQVKSSRATPARHNVELLVLTYVVSKESKEK